jgi:DNA-binding MarR family transcriptional regulator
MRMPTTSQAPSRGTDRAPGRPSEGPAETLETARLVVELLHAAYATRRDDAGSGATAMHGVRSGEAGRPAPPLSPHAVRAAIHVYQHRERTVSQLAAGLGISQGWASRVVEELEERGYLVKERDAVDRRVVWVRLSPDAIEDVERAFRWRDDVVSRALDGLDSDERVAVRTFLRRLVDGLHASASDGGAASDGAGATSDGDDGPRRAAAGAVHPASAGGA